MAPTRWRPTASTRDAAVPPSAPNSDRRTGMCGCVCSLSMRPPRAQRPRRRRRGPTSATRRSEEPTEFCSRLRVTRTTCVSRTVSGLSTKLPPLLRPDLWKTLTTSTTAGAVRPAECRDLRDRGGPSGSPCGSPFPRRPWRCRRNRRRRHPSASIRMPAGGSLNSGLVCLASGTCQVLPPRGAASRERGHRLGQWRSRAVSATVRGRQLHWSAARGGRDHGRCADGGDEQGVFTPEEAVGTHSGGGPPLGRELNERGDLCQSRLGAG